MAKVKLAGQTCVITGAGSGIGRALVERLASQGCPLAICDWNEQDLAETAAGLGEDVVTRKLDVSDRLAVLRFADEVREWAPSPIGALFNNAGVTVSQLVADTATEDDEWVMNVNYWGVVNGTSAFLPIMLEQGSGAVVNVSSIFGMIGWPSQASYCASKHAVRGYTEALRHELRGSGVAAIPIHPGGIATNIVKHSRFHSDDKGRTDREVIEADFEKVARTSPAKAAQIIQKGVESRKARIMVGADAKLLAFVLRFAPTRYYGLVARLGNAVRT